MKLKGKRALVTGSSQGFGLEVAMVFARQGADVMLCARDAGRLETARAKVASSAAQGVTVACRSTDVSEPGAMDRLVAECVQAFGGLDILVANAGIYGPKGAIESVDWAEWEQAIRVNLFGVVHACRAVAPVFKAQRAGKVIVLSGGGATKPMPMLSAYAASKAGVVRFAETFAGEMEPFGVDVNCVAPGELNTRLLDEVLDAGPEKVGKAFYDAAVKQRSAGGTPLSLGAELCVYLASNESDGVTGKLISAKWDPWRELGQHLPDLRGGDIYTLRRIVPADRGKSWGG